MRRALPVLLLVVACGGGTEATVDQHDWLWTDAADLPVVTVLDPGAEPHSLLEFQWSAGQSTTAVMEMHMVMTLTANSRRATVDMLMTAEIAAEVLEVVAEGYVTSTRILSVTVEASDTQIEDSLAAIYDELTDTPIIALVSRSGATLAIDRNTQESSALWSEVLGSLGSFTLPWPSEPVGEGATWEATMRTSTAEGSLLQTSTHRLTRREGNLLTIELTLVQGPDPDDPPPSNVELTLDGEGTGSQVIDLTALFPDPGISQATSRIGTTVTVDGASETMEQEMEVSMTIAPTR